MAYMQVAYMYLVFFSFPHRFPLSLYSIENRHFQSLAFEFLHTFILLKKKVCTNLTHTRAAESSIQPERNPHFSLLSLNFFSSKIAKLPSPPPPKHTSP